jgi:arylsulfatase A-like enzyme
VDERPFLLWFSSATPHHPWTPAARHVGAFDAAPAHRPPSLLEADVSDKPAWVATLPGDSALRRLQADVLRRRQLEMQLGVDEFVAVLMERLEALGILDETVVVYTSDNGHGWGEHRWLSKGCPWEECARVPLVVRDPRRAPLPRTEDALVSLVDLPATVADWAGVPMPGDRDGRSLLRTLDGTEPAPREEVLVESHIAPQLLWVSIRDARFKLVAWANGDLELYDLVADPDELSSLALHPEQQDRIARMQSRIMATWAGW